MVLPQLQGLGHRLGLFVHAGACFFSQIAERVRMTEGNKYFKEMILRPAGCAAFWFGPGPAANSYCQWMQTSLPDM